MDKEVPFLSRKSAAVRDMIPAVVLMLFPVMVFVGFAVLSWLDTSSADNARRQRLLDNQRLVSDTAVKLGLPPALLLAVAETESDFDDSAISPKGAVGILQVMPGTANEICSMLGSTEWALANPHDNIVIGGEYLKAMLRRYRGDIRLALAAYNCGPGAVDGWIAAGKGLPGPEVIEQFGLPETINYVSRVINLAGMDGFLRLHDSDHNRNHKPMRSPPSKPAVPSSRRPSIRYAHTVLTGETLSGIASANSISISRIIRLNNLTNPDRLLPGQPLVITPLVIHGKTDNRSETSAINTNIEIRIFKRERLLELWNQTGIIKKYKVALGFNPDRDKQVEGDGCTPEGVFYVCQKLATGKYGASLGISYPGIERAEKGLREGLISTEEYSAIRESIRAGRRPPWNTRLGGAICIHGRGNTFDWTAGCVAMADQDVNELFALVPMRSPVRIFSDRHDLENQSLLCALRND